MKWTDEEIDKLFQKGTDKVSFEYKPEYWEEFHASLPSSTSVSDLTDGDLDALFQESTKKSSFEYKPEYFEEFSASLPVENGIADLSDEELDSMFQEDANNSSFEYKPEYFKEFTTSLPVSDSVADLTDNKLDELFKESAKKSSINYKPEFWEEFSGSLPIIVPTEEITDSEVDELYKESVEDLSFEYKQSYWNEMLAMLKRRRRPDFLWFGFSGMFAAIIIYGIVTQQTPIGFDFDMETVSLEQTGTNTDRNTTSNTVNNNVNRIDNYITENPIESQVSNGKPVNYNAIETGNTPNGNQLGENKNPSIEGSNHTTAPENNLIANNTNGGKNNTLEIPTNTLQDVASEKLKTLAPELDSRSFKLDDFIEEVQAFRLNPLSLSSYPLSGDSLIPYPSNARNISTIGLYVQGIGGISQSSITPSEFLSNSYGIGAGIQVNRNNWSFGIGSNILIENYKDLHLTRTAKFYGFGSDYYKFDLFYKKLYVAELDLSIGYNLNRHQFKVGVRPSYTFSSKVNIAETSITNSKGLSSTETESRTGLYGFMDGIYQWGVKPTIGYAYNFRSDWTLGMNISTELMQSINEDFINGINNNLPFDGQLYIRKTFNLRK